MKTLTTPAGNDIIKFPVIFTEHLKQNVWATKHEALDKQVYCYKKNVVTPSCFTKVLSYLYYSSQGEN